MQGPNAPSYTVSYFGQFKCLKGVHCHVQNVIFWGVEIKALVNLVPLLVAKRIRVFYCVLFINVEGALAETLFIGDLYIRVCGGYNVVISMVYFNAT